MKQQLSEEFKRMQKLAGIIKEATFNDAGEPNMTYKQKMDYDEPSEPDYDDNYNESFDIKKEFINQMKKNDIFVETFDGDEYFIRCNVNEDFMIYFINDEEIEIYNTADGNNKQIFNYEEAVDYTLSNKSQFQSYDESVKDRNQENDIAFSDIRNNRAEMGGYGLG
jgi:hypothetical protein